MATAAWLSSTLDFWLPFWLFWLRCRILNKRGRKTYFSSIDSGSGAAVMAIDFLFGRPFSSFPARTGATRVKVSWNTTFKYPLWIDLGRPCRDTWPLSRPLDHSYLRHKFGPHNLIESDHLIVFEEETDLGHLCSREEIWVVGFAGIRIVRVASRVDTCPRVCQGAHGDWPRCWRIDPRGQSFIILTFTPIFLIFFK